MKKIVLLVALFITSLSFSQNNVFDIARKGTVKELKEISKENPDVLIQTNESGFTPLILAVYRGNREVVEFLIAEKAGIDFLSPMGTALSAACFKGDLSLVTLLLENEANPNIADQNGTTPLIYAVMAKNEELVDVLLKYKATKTNVDKNNMSAMDYARMSKNQEIINKLNK